MKSVRERARVALEEWEERLAEPELVIGIVRAAMGTKEQRALPKYFSESENERERRTDRRRAL